MTIGELAAAADVPAATVRYYEQRGLLARAPRTRAGYRVYDADAVRRLRFIKHAQALGFSLEDVRELLGLRVTDPASCTRVEGTTRDKLRHVRVRIRELRQMERVLESLLRACATRQSTDECPVLATLVEETMQPAEARPRDPRGQRGPRRRRVTNASPREDDHA